MADSFNINVKDVDTGGNFLNSSRGASPIEPTAAVKSTGGIAEAIAGFGDLFKNVVSGADQTIKQSINEELYRQTDQVFNEVGVGDVGVANSGPDTPPKALVGAFDNLQRVKDAMDSGAISKTNFDGRLVSVAQQLRYQYAGHREYIDNMMRQITGVRPQHQVYMDLMEESNKRVSQQQKEETQWNAALQHYGPDLPPLPAGATPQSIKQMYPTAGHIAAAALPVEQARKRLQDTTNALELATKNRTFTETEAMRGLNNQVNAQFNLAQAATSQMIGGTDGVDKFAKEFAANPSPEKLSAFVGQYKARNVAILNQMSDNVRAKVSEFKLPPSAYGELMGPIKENMKTQEDALEGGDFAMFKLMAVQNEAIRQGASGVVLGTDNMALIQAINKEMGPEVIKIMQAQSPLLRNAPATASSWNKMMQVWSNKRNGIIDTADPILKLSPEDRQTMLNTTQELIKSPTNSQEFKSKAVNFLYGPKNVGIMGSITESDRKVLWAKMTDPSIVAEMKKGSGLQYETYSQWAMNEFRDTFQRDFEGLMQRAKTTPGQVISFDDKTNRFTISTPEVPAMSGQDAYSAANKALVRRNAVRAQDQAVVDGINAGLTAIEPILKEKGTDIVGYLKGSFGAYALPGFQPKPTTGGDNPSKLGAGDVAKGVDLSGLDNNGTIPVVSQNASNALNMIAEGRQLQYDQNRQMSPRAGIDLEIQDLVKAYMEKPDADVLAQINDLVSQLNKASDIVPPVKRAEPPQSTIGDVTSVSKSSLK